MIGMKKTLSLILVLFGLVVTSQVHAAELTGSSIFSAINTERAVRQEASLKPSTALVKAAQAKATDMAQNAYFAHVSPIGRNSWDFIGRAGGYHIVGENLAVDFGDTESLITAWMNSPTHRANILDKEWKYTGIGITRTSSTVYVVQYFAD